MSGDGHISGKEWRWALTWAGVILALSCLPYLIAWAATPPGYQFSGILVNPFDGNSYLAKMRQGWAGSWQFHLTYTPEPHEGAYIFLFYLGLGHVARLTGLSLILVYHMARLLAGLAVLIAAYAFLVRLTSDRHERRLAFWLVGASAGLGWLGLVLGAFPIDLSVPEAFVFFSLMSNPHFPLAIALMLIVVQAAVWPASGIWRWLYPGLTALALALVQPLALAAVYAAVALYLLVRGWLERSWWGPGLVAAGGVGLFSVPVLLYDYRVYTTNPTLAAWAAQNVTPSPRVLDLILGYGLVGLLAIPGGMMVLRNRDAGGLALLAWSAATLTLVYMPLALQRRLLTGLGLPLAVLAAIGLNRWLLPKITGGWKRVAEALIVGLSLMGNLFLMAVLILGVLNRAGQADIFARLYLLRDEAIAMQWLLTHAQDEVVLASPRTGMMLPGRAGVRVFAGHPFETVDAERKQAQAEAFFRGELSGGEWQQLRDRYDIRYIWVGPAEQALGDGKYLGEMEPVFQQGRVTIYHLP
ncbi:MAG: hypothetical protein JSV81_12010 [Anaerolineales bacterium]|nr:MAG: hypothetical protein JSV81_12010 [Anaerolineales bacterium]